MGEAAIGGGGKETTAKGNCSWTRRMDYHNMASRDTLKQMFSRPTIIVQGARTMSLWCAIKRPIFRLPTRDLST
jgi:hypothetical protein